MRSANDPQNQQSADSDNDAHHDSDNAAQPSRSASAYHPTSNAEEER
jgi:hypothetical protein